MKKSTFIIASVLSMFNIFLVIAFLSPANSFAEEAKPLTEDCSHGGSGASSCSVGLGGGAGGVNLNGACSVSCMVGYYACCNLGNCRCVPMTVTGEVDDDNDKPAN